MDGSALFVLIIMAIVVIWIVNSYDSSEEKPKERKNNTMRNLPALPSLPPSLIEDSFPSIPRWSNLSTGYYPTSSVIMPDAKAIIAEQEPRRTIKMLQNLSLDRSFENITAAAAVEFARQGRGTRATIKRKRGWFSDDDSIEYTIKPL